MVNTMWGKIKEHIVSGLIGLIFTIIGGIILFHYQELVKSTNVNHPTEPMPRPKDSPLKNNCISKLDISGHWVLMKKVGDSWVPSDECYAKTREVE